MKTNVLKLSPQIITKRLYVIPLIHQGVEVNLPNQTQCDDGDPAH